MVLIENHGLVLALHIVYYSYAFVFLLLPLYFFFIFCVFFVLFVLYINDYVLLQLFGYFLLLNFLFLFDFPFTFHFVEPSLCIQLPIYTHSYFIVLLSSYCST
jgi:hypothetical protein